MTDNTNRIVGLDALRSILLLLLFVFHAAISFMVTDISNLWIYRDQSSSIILDGLVAFIHSFRLPTFFLISGIVTEHMYSRYSSVQVLKRRLTRIFLPFLLVLWTIVPLSNLIVAALNDYQIEYLPDILYTKLKWIPYRITTSYLWFLYYLIVFNVLHFGAHLFGLIDISRNLKSKKQMHFLHFCLLIACLLLLLFFNKKNNLWAEYNLTPSISSLLGYFIFYVSGMFISRNLGILNSLKKNKWMLIIAGILSLLIYLGLAYIKIVSNESANNFNIWLMLFSCLSSVCFTLGSIGLIVSYTWKNNATIHYISKSSYFLYLIHFPFSLLSIWLISSYAWNPITKFLFVLAFTLLFSFLFNHLWLKAWKNKSPI